MNIRQAIYLAADRIESKPDSFCYLECRKPACGSPGCMMGWIGFYAGIEEVRGDYMSQLRKALGFDFITIGAHVSSLRDSLPREEWIALMDFQSSAPMAAKAMRLFADAQFPAAKLPDWNAMAATRTIAANAVDEMART